MSTNKSQLAAALPWSPVRKSWEMCWHDPEQRRYVCLGTAPGLTWIRVLPKVYIFLMRMAASTLWRPGSYPLWDTIKERLLQDCQFYGCQGREDSWAPLGCPQEGREASWKAGTAVAGTCSQWLTGTCATALAWQESQGAKRKALQNADVKVDVQFDKVKRYQEQGLLQSGRTWRTPSEGCIGR